MEDFNEIAYTVLTHEFERINDEMRQLENKVKSDGRWEALEGYIRPFKAGLNRVKTKMANVNPLGVWPEGT